MKQVTFIRHGESTWNLENRFTGWTDVDLTPTGIAEAQEAGRLMKAEGITFKRAYTSYLKRAVKTLNVVLDRMDLDWIPVEKSWRLNEKHYGILQGLDKEETVKKYGAEQVLAWRRSYTEAPPPVSKDDPRNPRLDPRYVDIPTGQLPMTESLHDAVLRVLPYWQEVILPSLQRDHSVLIVAHGNSLRGIIKYIKAISNDDIVAFNLPTGVPYLFEFDDNMHLLSDRFVGNPDEISNRIQKAAQTKKS